MPVIVAPAHTGPSRAASGPRTRAAYAATGLAALAGAVALLGPWAFAIWLVPDVALLAGWSRGFAEHGRLAPRAVPLYNALHMLVGPLGLIAVGLVIGPAALGFGVLWLSHALLDRAMGYGLRTREGWQRG